MKTLIIDANYFCYRSHYSRGKAKMIYDDDRTDIIFGFLSDMKTLGTQFRTNQFIFCWDSKISKRKLIFPEYKNRNKDLTEEQKEELQKSYVQFNLLREEVLPAIGFMTQVQVDGYEADDHIAKTVMTYPHLDSVICSTDHDLYQLLDYAPIHNPVTSTMYSLTSLNEEFGITPDQWPIVKAVAGCTSDNVEGLKNVGEKGIATYLRGELKPHTKKYKAISEGIDAIKEKNLPLVQLPFPGTPPVKLLRNKPVKETYSGFIEICRRYGFNSFLSADNLYLWKHFLNGYGAAGAVETAIRIAKKRAIDRISARNCNG